MNEYVNRKDLRDALYDADAITMEGVKIINQFPSVDAAPVRHGHWIYHMDNVFPNDSTQECSYCHEELRLRGVGVTEYFGPCNENHCPTCGAKMEGWVIE